MDITPQSPKGGAARFRNSGVSLVNLKESWRFYEELKKYLSEDVEEKLARSICAEVLGTDTNFQSNIEDYMSTASIKRHHFLEGTLCFWMSKVDAAQATGYSLFAMLESIDKRVAKSCEHFLKDSHRCLYDTTSTEVFTELCSLSRTGFAANMQR
ncbi:uncharacterized protein LOC135822628 [Sycon ciliatum]|uniref:uncharacterized protein LOC135822628 n=1 Tax=Sycon ciliatum TaxID=27933 RepID=UPI0031F6D747